MRYKLGFKGKSLKPLLFNYHWKLFPSDPNPLFASPAGARRDQSRVGTFFTIWATREACRVWAFLVKPMEKPTWTRKSALTSGNHIILKVLQINVSIKARRKWQPTPVFMPGKSHGRRSLVGYSLWGRKESDTTEWLHFIYLSKKRHSTHATNIGRH